MYPIYEDIHLRNSIDREAYINTFKKCRSDLKEMRIGVDSCRGFIALRKLKEVIKDIEAIKSGNFILVED